MPTISLTEITLRNVKPPTTGQVMYWDTQLRGFGVRASRGGTLTFAVVLGKERRRVTIGPVRLMKLAQARERAKELLAEHVLTNRGVATVKVGKALDQFVAFCERRNKPSTAAETKRLLDRHFRPILEHKTFEHITAQEVAKILDGLSDAPSEASHALTAFKTFNRWALGRGYVSVVVSASIPRASRVQTRARVLSEEELEKVWNAVAQLPVYGTIARLLILTGQRLNQIASLRGEFIDRRKKRITWPAELMKGNRPHTIPCGDMTAALLAELPKEGALFVTERGKPFANWSSAKRDLDRISMVSDWTLHDLRRTFATQLASLGVAPHIIERLLDHRTGTISGVAAIYNRFSYEEECRKAIEAWEQRLRGLLARQ